MQVNINNTGKQLLKAFRSSTAEDFSIFYFHQFFLPGFFQLLKEWMDEWINEWMIFWHFIFLKRIWFKMLDILSQWNYSAHDIFLLIFLFLSNQPCRASVVVTSCRYPTQWKVTTERTCALLKTRREQNEHLRQSGLKVSLAPSVILWYITFL